MKPEKWNEGLNHLDADLVEEFVEYKDANKKKKSARPHWIATIAATLVVTIGIGILAGNGILPGLDNKPLPTESAPPTTPPGGPGPETGAPIPVPPTGPAATLPPLGPVVVPQGKLLAKPVYPKMVQYPNRKDYDGISAYNIAYSAWLDSQRQQYNQPFDYADSLTDFFHRSIAQFLQGDDNQVYSPVNVYLAMAMLAETADGDSRQQILDLFGVETIEQLQAQAYYLWNAHYCDDGQTSTLLANSLWLDEKYTFKQETAHILAQRYFASTYRGDLGTDEMNEQLQSWLNANTGDLLQDQAKNVELSKETIFALASTIYFTASWQDDFNVYSTTDAIFHSPDADRTVPFMYNKMRSTYYWGEHFSAVQLMLTGNNAMWLILPDEGYTVDDVLESDEYLQMMLDPMAWKNREQCEIKLSLPKFDVTCQQDLIDGMKALGLTDIFDYTRADFTPITDESFLYVDMINHAARVSIDEKGCLGAGFTVIGVPMGTAPPKEVKEINFTLNRPFFFAVSSRDNLPLFTGVVNEP